MTKPSTRRTRAELRELMLAGGKDVLHTVEPSLGFEELTYSAVFDRLQSHYGQRVTIGSVHERIWASQSEFRLDVIAEALRDLVQPASNFALERALEAIGRLDLNTPTLRRFALQTAIRLNSAQLFSSPQQEMLDLAQAVRFRLWSLHADHPGAERLRASIEQLRLDSTAAYTDVARAIIGAVGARVRADAGDPDKVIELIALLGNAVVVGLSTDVIEQAGASHQLPTGLHGELEEWYPDAIALWSYARSMFELDGDDLTDDERRL